MKTSSTRVLIRGVLFAAAIAACDSSTEPKTDGPDNTDVQEALNALPEATVLLYTPDGVPQYIVGELGKIEATSPSGLAKDDAGLRVALPPILKAFRLQSPDMVLRKVNTDAQGA